MSQWWIAPSDGQVVIDDASIDGIDTTGIASNIYLVFWHGTKGEILYKHADRMPLRETFIDVTPYIHYFDRWITAAQSETPPIQLPQAKSVKSSLVHSLFESKRQLPINVGGVWYDASDTNMATMMGSLTTDALVGAINASITQWNQILATFNTAIATFNAYIDIFNNNSGLQDHVIEVGVVNQINVDVAMLNSGSYVEAINTAIDSVTVTMGGDPPTPSVSFTPIPTPQSLQNASGRVAAGGQVPVLEHLDPVQGTFPLVSLAQSATGAVVNAISARTNALAAVRNTHLANIATLTTVAAIAAYDITAGW
jgi:hypothetical protein